MRLARLTFAVFFILAAAPALAQVSCADPDNLCTGDPCTITTVEVQSPCVVDFGARDLVIAGTLDVPNAGTLDFTAEDILLQGRIDGRHVGNGVGSGASITLTATVGDAELRGEIDVTGTAANGSIDVSAAANILVKDNLNAKTSGANITATGGVISLVAGGTIDTDQTAVLDAQGSDTTAGGSISLNCSGNATVKGRVRTEGSPAGTIAITSSASSVTVEKDLRVGSEQGAAGLVTVSGDAGVTLLDAVRAVSEVASGGDVIVTSANGDVTIDDQVRVGGVSGGSITIDALAGTVAPRARLNARGNLTGGAVDIEAATIELRKDIDARSGQGDGGTVQLKATTLLDILGADVVASGKVNAGTIALLGDAASGDVSLSFSKLTAKASQGAAGSLTVSAPAGAVSFTKVTTTLTAKSGLGGQGQIDGIGITIGGKTRFNARDGGEIRFDQSGAGLFTLAATFDVRAGGVVEALAPAGSLTASGKIATDGGCAGFAAGGTLDTTGVVADVPLSASCP